MATINFQAFSSSSSTSGQGAETWLTNPKSKLHGRKLKAGYSSPYRGNGIPNNLGVDIPTTYGAKGGSLFQVLGAQGQKALRDMGTAHGKALADMDTPDGPMVTGPDINWSFGAIQGRALGILISVGAYTPPETTEGQMAMVEQWGSLLGHYLSTITVPV